LCLDIRPERKDGRRVGRFIKTDSGWVWNRIKKEGGNGFGIGFDRDGRIDPLGSNGHGIWVEGGMALGGHRSRNRRRFPDQKESGCLDYDDHWDFYPECKILLDSY
jgi:hypothetical protein